MMAEITDPRDIELSFGFSSCPNDTFIFHALAHGLVTSPFFRPGRILIEDVEQLNRLALERVLDVSKMSFHAWGHMRRHYTLLDAGSALGRGCGPLLVASDVNVIRRLPEVRIAIPGVYTTAALLLRLYEPRCRCLIPMRFDRIMPSVLRGEVEAGLLIHEGRFTCKEQGLRQLVDLGQWWEKESGLPLPLGCIAARHSLGAEVLLAVTQAVRSSVEYAWRHPSASRDYISYHAQELREDVLADHIATYVNDFSRDMGDEGRAAVDELLRRAVS